MLLSSNDSLADLKDRINAYSGLYTRKQKNPSYNNFVGNLISIETITSTDRIGIRFKESGFFNAIDDFDEMENYIVDINYVILEEE